ncbi:UPF0488 protein CG14286 [Phlebotomus papatasi]|uniref:UPF0488 protein CG14286 n=1 Tax=Phlebotomus papatasi TaxID=29031 RepID=UPI0024838070|nr:UPF0488 protein CG14286 [Phlebotomus papatasi]
MPPPKVKLHKSSGKVKTLQSMKPAEESSSQVVENNAELELCWCIQKLELSLSSGMLSQKLAQDAEKTLRILKGANQPLVKKRQVMRNAFGDYRAQMAREEKQLSLASGKIKFTDPKEQKNSAKSYFVKKSALLNSGSDFKFNFNVNEAEKSQENVNLVEENTLPRKEVPSSSKYIPSDNSFRFNFVIPEESS